MSKLSIAFMIFLVLISLVLLAVDPASGIVSILCSLIIFALLKKDEE
jgi:hypothetical protein